MDDHFSSHFLDGVTLPLLFDWLLRVLCPSARRTSASLGLGGRCERSMVTDALHIASVDFLLFLRTSTLVPLKLGFIVTAKFSASPRQHLRPGGSSFDNLRDVLHSRLQRRLAKGSQPGDGGR